MYYLNSPCKVCGMPVLGIRVCGGEKKHKFVMCEECDAVWLNPELDDIPYYPEENDLKCPYGDGTLMSPDSKWATEEQIKDIGWWKYIQEPIE